MTRPLVVNASAARQVRVARRLEKLRSESEADHLKAVMGTAEGRAFVWRLLGEAGVNRLSFSADPYSTAFAEGRRNLGLWLTVELNRVCPDAYLDMQHEAMERAAELEKRKPQPLKVETQDTEPETEDNLTDG